MTLIELPGLGRRWYERAWLKAIGSELLHHPTLSGRTERAITTELLATHGVEQTEEFIERMFTALEAVVAEDRGTLAQHGRVFPGAEEALVALGALPTVVQTLVTGNLASVAGYKLVPFGLDAHLDFEIGGYGALSAHRPDLVAAAMRNAARKHGAAFAAESVVVIGDTPHDVEAALEHGALAVGVATGVFSEAELRESGAHVTFPELSDTKAVLSAILRQA